MIIFSVNNIKEKIEKRKKKIIKREAKRLEREIIKSLKHALRNDNFSTIGLQIEYKHENFYREIRQQLIENLNKNPKYKDIEFRISDEFTIRQWVDIKINI